MDCSTSLVSSQLLVNVVLCAVFDTFPAQIRVLYQLILTGIRTWQHLALHVFGWEANTGSAVLNDLLCLWICFLHSVSIYNSVWVGKKGETVNLQVCFFWTIITANSSSIDSAAQKTWLQHRKGVSKITKAFVFYNTARCFPIVYKYKSAWLK